MEIHSLAVSGADRMLAAGCSDGVVEIWAPALFGKMKAPLMRGQGHAKAVRAVGFCPVDPVAGGEAYHLLASGSVDGTVRTWHLGDKARDQVLDHHESSVLALAWSPDGAWLATGSEDETWALVDRDGRAQRHVAGRGSVLALAWSPDGAHVATGSYDRMLRVWDPTSGRIVAQLEVGDAVWSLRFTRDGGAIVYACGSAIGRWRWQTQDARRWREPHRDRVYRAYAVAIPPAGDGFAASFGRDVAFVDGEHARHLRTASGHQATISSLAYLGDGRLASGDEAGELCVWEPGAATPCARMRARA